MMIRNESQPDTQTVLKPFDCGIDHLFQTSTPGADQMVMMSMPVEVLIPQSAILELQLPTQTGFRQQFHRAIYGGYPHPGISTASQVQDFLGGQMPVFI
jgi:hypothetical protein